MENRSILSCPTRFDKADLLDILSLSAGAAFLHQNRMGERIIGDNGWELNPSEGLIRFGGQEFRAGILGSESHIQNTWLWSWAHTESGLPEKAVAASRRAICSSVSVQSKVEQFSCASLTLRTPQSAVET